MHYFYLNICKTIFVILVIFFKSESRGQAALYVSSQFDKASGRSLHIKACIAILMESLPTNSIRGLTETWVASAGSQVSTT